MYETGRKQESLRSKLEKPEGWIGQTPDFGDLLLMLDYSLANSTTPLLEVTQLEDLLIYLSQTHQVDLTGYKRSTLMRRTLLRMQRVGVKDYQDYLAYLRQQPDEVVHLLDTVFINFTNFFRDPLVWGYLADQVIPKIVASKAPDEPIRVWSAGCASGEEAYSLAILLIEALGIEQFQQRVWIYGTDIDPDAILQARKGYYPIYKVEAMPAALHEKYFERCRDHYRYCWREDMRCSMSFHQHNLIRDSPLPEIDLLLCRNLLMYFTPETQLQALANLYDSLQEKGFLLLGNVETLVTPAERLLFTPIHWQNRLFKRCHIRR